MKQLLFRIQKSRSRFIVNGGVQAPFIRYPLALPFSPRRRVLVFPIIDMAATGRNIQALRVQNGYSVRDVQEYFGFDQPQAIYRWQQGLTLPTLDNLYGNSCFALPRSHANVILLFSYYLY